MKKLRRALLLAGVTVAGLAGLAFAQGLTTLFTTNNQSATITTGNTFQQVLAASKNRRGITIQNNNATDTCWISFGQINGVTITAGNATKGTSIELLAGGSYQRYAPSYVPPDAFIATCASNGDFLYIDTQ